MRPSEELSLTLSSELILKVGKLSVAISNDIAVGYYDTPLINTNTMASPLKHGDMSCHMVCMWDNALSTGLIYYRYHSSILVLLTVGYLTHSHAPSLGLVNHCFPQVESFPRFTTPVLGPSNLHSCFLPLPPLLLICAAPPECRVMHLGQFWGSRRESPSLLLSGVLWFQLSHLLFLRFVLISCI